MCKFLSKSWGEVVPFQPLGDLTWNDPHTYLNAKYQMHRTLRELASPRNSAQYPNIQINDDTLGTLYKAFSMYLKSEFVNFYRVACNLANC